LPRVVVPARGAAVNVTNQTRSIHVAIPSITADPGIDQTVTAPDNNEFNETLDESLNQLDQNNSAIADQDSSFGELANVFTATAHGSTQYRARGLEGIVFSESNFSITFTLAEARDYTINGTGSFPDTTSGASNFSVILTGPGGTTIDSFTKADFDPANGDGAQIDPTFDNSGTLAAGEYTLAAQSGVSGGTNTTGITAGFSVNFTATAADDGGGGGGGGGQIPLPAAVWPGGDDAGWNGSGVEEAPASRISERKSKMWKTTNGREGIPLSAVFLFSFFAFRSLFQQLVFHLIQPQPPLSAEPHARADVLRFRRDVGGEFVLGPWGGAADRALVPC
jgi:hypothetical protein